MGFVSARIIHVHPEAPSKPRWAQPCNGCGVCCVAEPCPLGVVLSLRRSGPCRKLLWDEGARRYTCGALGNSGESAGWWQRWRRRFVARWIAAGAGCDCDWEASVASSEVSNATALHHDPGTR